MEGSQTPLMCSRSHAILQQNKACTRSLSCSRDVLYGSVLPQKPVLSARDYRQGFYDWHGRVILEFTVHYIFQHGVYIFFPGSSELKTLQLMKPVIHEGSVLWWKEDRPHKPKHYSDRGRKLSDASPPHRASASVYTWKQLTFFLF